MSIDALYNPIKIGLFNWKYANLELWESGIRDPFEIHVQPPEKAQLYASKLVKVD